MCFRVTHSNTLCLTPPPALQAWLLSSGNDGRVSIFDTTRTQPSADGLPSQLVMQHIGHIGNIMDAQWSPHEDFMVMSVSNDGETYKEGGALQLWRMSWLLTSPFELVEGELKTHQKWLVRPCTPGLLRAARCLLCMLPCALSGSLWRHRPGAELYGSDGDGALRNGGGSAATCHGEMYGSVGVHL